MCVCAQVTIPVVQELSVSVVAAGSSEVPPPSQHCPHFPFLITEESLASGVSLQCTIKLTIKQVKVDHHISVFMCFMYLKLLAAP